MACILHKSLLIIIDKMQFNYFIFQHILPISYNYLMLVFFKSLNIIF